MNDKMNVLLVSAQTTGSPGGIATWTNAYLNENCSGIFNCTLINTAQIGKRREQGNSKINIAEEFVRTENIFKSLARNLKENNFDVAHINTSCGPLGLIRDYFCVNKIKKNNIPVVVHFHCDIPFWVKNKGSLYFLKRLADKADKLLVLCDNSKEFLKNTTGKESEKIPNFVNEGLCLKEHRKIKETINKILFVGYVQPEKGVYEIYELAEQFKDKEFILAGEVRADISETQKPDNVKHLGRVDKEGVISLLDESDLFLFPTHSEGFSMSLAEAMSRGVPSVATNAGANLDMLEDMGGRVVKIGDVGAMKAAVFELEDASVRLEMSEWCINKVRSTYTTPIILKRLGEIYSETAKK